jgi:beta-galactosidase
MASWSRRTVIQSGVAASLAPWVARQPLAPAVASGRERLLLDFGWRFHLGHATDPALDFGFGAGSEFDKSGGLFRPSRANFDDSTWRTVNLPHDWVVELPFDSADELNDAGHHPVGRNFPATSVGWYRRVFTLPASDAGRRISLEFDGIYRDALIAINGHLVGRNFSGYAPFVVDVTDIVTTSGRNVLVVRADATEREGWFYEGAGIYRHVWLVKTAPIHVSHWGTFVTSTVTDASAVVHVATELGNDHDDPVECVVTQTVVDGTGRTVSQGRSAPVRIDGWTGSSVPLDLPVLAARLWSIEDPAMHTLITTVEVAGHEVDRYATPFGIRTMRFDPDRGFFLNGKRVAIKGTCNHQDHAGVGSALPDRLQSYRIERLKAMGSNAYRTSHNPPTPELLDACDRLGMLVLDENRTFSPEPEGMSQLERMIRRDRNHPSVFAWSLANEEGSDQGNNRGVQMASTLRRLAHRLDPTRPVTAAMNGGWGKGFTLVVDVQGFNYFLGDIDAIHKQFPAKPMIGTETASTLSTRGIYANDKDRGYLSAYDVNKPGWGALAEEWWTYFAARPFLAGGFVWTGFDYRGEPTPYRWPCISSHFGLMDTCGFPKDNFYYYQVWWGDKPAIHLFPHWNWAGHDGEEIDVWVYSNADEVELFVNGKSLGKLPMGRNSHLAWKVPYAPGKIEARGFSGGKETARDVRETTGAPTAIVLRPDRDRINADGEDLVVFEVQVVDAAGRIVPTADDAVTFTVSGPGAIIGVGNGDPSSHEADKGSARRAFNGLCCAIVQGTKTAGSIRVEATAPGLRTATATVGAAQATPRPTVD